MICTRWTSLMDSRLPMANRGPGQYRLLVVVRRRNRFAFGRGILCGTAPIPVVGFSSSVQYQWSTYFLTAVQVPAGSRNRRFGVERSHPAQNVSVSERNHLCQMTLVPWLYFLRSDYNIVVGIFSCPAATREAVTVVLGRSEPTSVIRRRSASDSASPQ